MDKRYKSILTIFYLSISLIVFYLLFFLTSKSVIIFLGIKVGKYSVQTSCLIGAILGFMFISTQLFILILNRPLQAALDILGIDNSSQQAEVIKKVSNFYFGNNDIGINTDIEFISKSDIGLKVEQLIKDNELEKAISFLLDRGLNLDARNYDSFVVISNEYKEIMKHEVRGLSDHQYIQKVKNHIASRILDVSKKL